MSHAHATGGYGERRAACERGAAIMGVGATKRVSAVRWGVARSIVTAWVLTFPMAGAMAAGTYLLLRYVLQLP